MKHDTLEGKAKTKNGVKRLCFSGEDFPLSEKYKFIFCVNVFPISTIENSN